MRDEKALYLIKTHFPTAMSATRKYRYYVAYQPTGMRFSRTELMHIGIAVAVLTVAFAFAFSDLIYNLDLYTQNVSIIIYILLGAFAAVGTGFILHELAHKRLAQKYGCWAEFRSDRMGLILALITGLIGFVYAAPGAVFIAGRINKEQNGKISLVGPMTNLVIALSFLAMFLIAPSFLLFAVPIPSAGNLTFIISIPLLVALVNIFLAGFNMIPIMPLDGAKVAHWNMGIYIATFAMIILVGIYLFFFQPPPMGLFS